jgi:hypothetical protein
MNLRCCARVRIGNVGMLTSERSSLSEEYVEVLGMKCSLVMLTVIVCWSSMWFFLDDGDGGLGWMLWLRLCSSVARGMYPTSLVKE